MFKNSTFAVLVWIVTFDIVDRAVLPEDPRVGGFSTHVLSGITRI